MLVRSGTNRRLVESVLDVRRKARTRVATASLGYTHAEGLSTTASANSSHAEGAGTVASGNYSHSEGNTTTASGVAAHAEGYATTASGDYAHSEGHTTTADGDYSHAGGRLADTNSFDGVFIWADSENAALTADQANQFKVRASGGVFLRQNVDATGQEVLELSQGDDEGSFINYIGTNGGASYDKHISTQNGNGVVTGPKDQAGTDGWDFSGMVQISINGVAYWMPFYTPDPVP